ncbi:MAG: hypothetical protein OHK0013_05590 [Sandaracinaceae bacterium]
MARRVTLDPHVSELLGATDAYLAMRPRRWRTLDPSARRPRSLVTLGERLLPARSGRPALHEQQEIAWAMAMSDLARAIVREFPENIFADLDHVGAVLRDVVAREGHVALERRIDPLVRIHRLYGRASSIRFRYVHDFLYGFDWARWVRRDPETRRGVGPFDAVFLAHVEARAAELAARIEAGDPEYPPLPASAFRNPFPFDRDPEAEGRLFPSLVARKLIPVEAWREQPELGWEHPFTELRVEHAASLGLTLG